jgi:DNA replication licensing factor MCM4
MRLWSDIELCNVQEAYHLMCDAIQTSALDPTMGKMDMGLLNTSMGQQQRKLYEDMQKEILALLAATPAVLHGIH